MSIPFHFLERRWKDRLCGKAARSAALVTVDSPDKALWSQVEQIEFGSGFTVLAWVSQCSPMISNTWSVSHQTKFPYSATSNNISHVLNKGEHYLSSKRESPYWAPETKTISMRILWRTEHQSTWCVRRPPFSGKKGCIEVDSSFQDSKATDGKDVHIFRTFIKVSIESLEWLIIPQCIIRVFGEQGAIELSLWNTALFSDQDCTKGSGFDNVTCSRDTFNFLITLYKTNR